MIKQAVFLTRLEHVRLSGCFFLNRAYLSSTPRLIAGSHQAADGASAPRESHPRQDLCRLLSLRVTPHAETGAVRSGCD